MLIDCRWMAVTVPEPDYRTSKDKFKSAFKRARKEVAEQWALCLGETKRLQVAISRARPEAAREVLKYAVKPQELADSPLPLGPLLKILRVSRLVSAFGSVRASRLAELQEQAGEERPGVVCACGCSESLPSFVVDRINEVRKIEGDRRRIVSMPVGTMWKKGKNGFHRDWIVSA
jgi:hypothetical protein